MASVGTTSTAVRDGSVTPADAATVSVPAVMEQSPLDDRRYRRVTLPNGLRVLLVADDAAETAAACLAIAVGHCSNPPELPGLAHLCEHMVFLGSAKYPEEEAYSKFIQEHGGHQNAVTTPERTYYYMSVMVGKGGGKNGEGETKRATSGAGGPAASDGPDVGPPAADASIADAFAADVPAAAAPALDIPADVPPGLAPYYEALDRFAQFFISPLFTPSATSREVQAVHSEHQNALLRDSDRVMQLFKSAAAPGHPFRLFDTGNAASLWDRPTEQGIDVREALLAFHGKQYSANRMTLVLVAPTSLDDLAVWAEALFGAVPNTGAPLAADAYAGLVAYGPAETSRLIRVVPVVETRQVRLLWSVPPFGATYRTDPVGFLADRVNYAGPGSLLSALKARGWVSSLWAGTGVRSTHWQMFDVSVRLTLAGAGNTDAVIGAVFSYLDLIGEQGITPLAYAEVAASARLAWTYRERAEPLSVAVGLSQAMHELPDAHLLTGEYLYEVYDEDLIRSTLALLTPAAAVVVRIDPAFAGTTDKVDEWYGTNYSAEAVHVAQLTGWADAEAWPELAVAPPNAFVPTDLSLVCDAIDGADDEAPAAASASSTPKASTEESTLEQPALEQPTADKTKTEIVGEPSATNDSGTGHGSTVPCGDGVKTPVVAKVVDDAAVSAPPPPTANGYTPTPYRPFPLLPTPVLPADATASVDPVVLRDDVDASVRLHYKLDRTFRRPEAHFLVNIVTSALCATPRSWILALLAVYLLKDDLTEETYDAGESGLFYNVRATNRGFSLDVFGFSDKLPLLLRLVVDRLANLRADPDRFARVLEVLHHGYKNIAKNSPLSHAGTVTSLLLYPALIHVEDLLYCFVDGPDGSSKTSGPVGRRARMRPPAPTPAELEVFMASVWQRGVSIEVLVTGNVRPADALAMTAVVEDALHAPPLPALEHFVSRVVELPPRRPVIARIVSPNPKDANSAVQVTFQVGPSGDPSADVTLGLLARMLSDHVYTVLRTKQQLGYLVSAWSQNVAGIKSLCVVVQSPSASPETITDRILACLDEFGAYTLPKMDPTPFKAALTTALREPAKQLSLETGRFLSEINKHTYNYGRRAAEADALEVVNTATLLRLWATHFAADAPQRRMLVATVHPPQHPPALTPAEERAAGGVGGGDALPPIVVDDVAAYPVAVRAFRNSRPLYPMEGYSEPGATGF